MSFRKLKSPAIRPRGRRPVRRPAGRYGTGYTGWAPHQVISPHEEATERSLIQRRAEELVESDPFAAGAIESTAANVIGRGLRAQSSLPYRLLGIPEDEAMQIQADMEAAFELWQTESHSRGLATFGDLQFMNISTMLSLGDSVFLPRMSKAPGRTFGFCLLDLHPQRVATPANMQTRTDIIDGVEIDDDGRPVAYWVGNPPKGTPAATLSSPDFERVPARRGHWPGFIHCYRYTQPEMYRGRSVFSSGAKLHRQLDTALDYSLIGQIIAASFPVFISSQSGPPTLPALGGQQDFEAEEYPLVQEYAPGQVIYGRPGDDARTLSSNIPGPNFVEFSKVVLRAMSASLNIPYEVLSKDFSESNYSSARAAMLEAWRMFQIYRAHAGAHFAQICWNCVIEEAFLRGMWSTGSGPDFYDARQLWTRARWIGPARGYVDPVKEVVSYVKGLDAGIFTLADVAAEQGQDWEDTVDQRKREKQRLHEAGLKEEDDNAA
ncbi:phage portal protein [Desulfovibrio oxyclinae]|uniref:phage portal protein n=1 Tax=Desulfovibrio oxyclinae TaxID=63560 RepID=UPI000372DDEF|nr:phage portal protein [Desulfovibrio oxyclinae]